MALYFFDHRDNDGFIEDDVGLEYSDLAHAQVEAARALAEYAVDVIPGSFRRVMSIEVRDENGPIFATRIVFEIIRMRGEPDQFGREQSQAQH